MTQPPTGTRGAVTRNIGLVGSIVSQIPASEQEIEAQSARTVFQQLNLLEPTQQTVSIAPCRSCGATEAIEIPGSGPHYAGLKCSNCGRWIKWLGKPKGEA